MTITDLPSDWQTLPLERVLEVLPSGGRVQQGWSPQCDKDAAGPYEWGVLKTTAIQPGAFHPEHNKRLPAHFDPRPAIEVAAGDLLLTNAGPRARCAVPCLVRTTRPRLMLSGKIYRFRADKSIVDPRFLEFFLLAPSTQHLLDRMKTGISDSGLNLTRGRFLGLPVVVPPTKEQLRIVDLLEQYVSRIDIGVRLLDKTSRRSQSLYLAGLRDEFASRDLVPLTEVATIVNGHTPAGIKDVARPEPFPEAIPFFKVGDMNQTDGASMSSARAYVTEGQARALRLRVAEAGTVVFPKRGGAIATNKKRLLKVRGAFDLNTMGVVPSKDLAPEYLYCWFEQVRLSSLADGSNVPQINTPDISGLALPVPSLEVQAATLQRLQTLRGAVDSLSVTAPRLRAASLRRAVLDAAFSGGLTHSGSRPSPKESSRV